MDTKSKIHEALATLGIGTHSSQIEELVADALNELAALQQDRAVGAKLRMLLGANEGESTVDALQRYTAAVQLGCALKLEQRATELSASSVGAVFAAIEGVPSSVIVAALIGGATLLRQGVEETTGQQPARHPCSATCTHDDAATPGHPERLKERSEAVEEIGRHPENDSDTFRTIENGVEGAVFTRTQTERYAEKKAESMRAACWIEVQSFLAVRGYNANDQEWWNGLKAAIEGAAP